MPKKLILFCFTLLCTMSGCAIIEKADRADFLEQKVFTLSQQIQREKADNETEITRLLQQKKIEQEDIINLKEQEIERIINEKNQQLSRLMEERKRDKQLYQMLAQKERYTKEELISKENQLKQLIEQKDKHLQVIQEKETHISSLEEAQKSLEQSLKSELNDYKAKLEMTERGLVITFLAEIFFDSGKADVRDDAKNTLQKVADVLNSSVKDSRLAIEGHTDNDPITHSHWQSNWELSTARALAVLHHFIEQNNVKPKRLSAVGYGEYQPIASNNTREGKAQNRRVEIVILPNNLEKKGFIN